MLRKKRLRQENGFLIKKNLYSDYCVIYEENFFVFFLKD